jgi:hypothetical protein
MSLIIFTPASSSIVSIVHPSSGTADAALAAKTVPSGISYEIVADNVVPTDATFTEAWRKVGATIEVNLAAAKVVAENRLKIGALNAIKASSDATALGETPTYTPSAIETAYTTAKTNVNADTTVAAIKTELDAFISTYDS